MQKVRFFQADCRDCTKKFPFPLLSDFAYGDFILHGEKGDVFGFLPALNNSTWEEITSRLLKLVGQ
jgi:hypothetical protein